MLERRTRHASVSMGSKMSVIGGDTTSSYELFDEDIGSKKFVYLKHIFNSPEFDIKYRYLQSVCIGNRIVLCLLPNREQKYVL